MRQQPKSLMAKTLCTFLVASTLAGLLPLWASANEGVAPIQAGQMVSFSLQRLEGGMLTSSELTGRVVLLAIGAKSSPLDRYLLPQLATVASKMRGKPVEVIWVSTDGTKAGARGSATDEEIRAFAQKYRFDGTILRDPGHTLDHQLGISQLPALLILDQKGQLSAPPRMGLDPESDITKDLTAQIDRLLS